VMQIQKIRVPMPRGSREKFKGGVPSNLISAMPLEAQCHAGLLFPLSIPFAPGPSGLALSLTC
jgi:hypothetical protein